MEFTKALEKSIEESEEAFEKGFYFPQPPSPDFFTEAPTPEFIGGYSKLNHCFQSPLQFNNLSMFLASPVQI